MQIRLRRRDTTRRDVTRHLVHREHLEHRKHLVRREHLANLCELLWFRGALCLFEPCALFGALIGRRTVAARSPLGKHSIFVKYH